MRARRGTMTRGTRRAERGAASHRRFTSIFERSWERSGGGCVHLNASQQKTEGSRCEVAGGRAYTLATARPLPSPQFPIGRPTACASCLPAHGFSSSRALLTASMSFLRSFSESWRLSSRSNRSCTSAHCPLDSRMRETSPCLVADRVSLSPSELRAPNA
eukprot:scaffold66049_cov28-Tisochrysis_lutea.AAC.9